MAVSVPARIYRNRHGGFYFRLTVPKNLRTVAGRSEFQFSLGTELHRAAIICALPMIADLTRLVRHLLHRIDRG